MKEQLKQRLQELKREFDTGQTTLQDLEAQANSLRKTLMRISGAIQVLEEELSKADVLLRQDTEQFNGSEDEAGKHT